MQILLSNFQKGVCLLGGVQGNAWVFWRESNEMFHLLLVSGLDWLFGDVAQFTFISCNKKNKQKVG